MKVYKKFEIFNFPHFFLDPNILNSILIFSFLFICGCSKERLNTKIYDSSTTHKEISLRDGGSATDYALTTTNVTVVDGMLYFPSYDELYQVINSLDTLAYDEEKNLEVLNILGFEDFEFDGAPEAPILNEFNGRFGITTLREKLEYLEKQEDETGQDLSQEIDKVVFWEPVLGSLINLKNEIRIGNLIYKYLDEDRTVIFRSGDQSLLNLIRTTEDPFTLQNQYNFFKIDGRKSTDRDLYKKIEAANMNGDCFFNITWSNTGNHYYFHSIGYFPTGGNVVWKVKDSNGVTLSSQTGSSTFNYLIPVGVQFPLYISIESEGCDPYVQVFAQSSPNQGYNCDLFDFDYTISPQIITQISFIIPPNTPTIYWNFGDGNTLTSLPTGNSESIIIHNYPSGPVAYTVCASIQTENCNKTICKEIVISDCGNRKSFKRKKTFYYSANASAAYYARLKISLKDPLFNSNRIYAKVKNYYANDFNRKKAVGLSIAWSSPSPSFICRYYIPTVNSGCGLKEEGLFLSNTGKSKLHGKRNVPNGTAFNDIDINCTFTIFMFTPTMPFSTSLTY